MEPVLLVWLRATSLADFERTTELIFRLAQAHDSLPSFGTSRHGRFSDNKRSYWRFLRPTLKPFEELCPRIKPHGRGLFAFFKLAYQMPDERQEIRIKRPASHTVLLAFYSYTIVIRWTQEDVY